MRFELGVLYTVGHFEGYKIFPLHSKKTMIWNK
jgi:hypothetical protein